MPRTFSLSGSQQHDFYVIQGDTPPGGSTSADVAISQEVLASSVPEPSRWAMMMLGFAGLGFAAYGGRGRRAAISIV